MDSNAWLGQSMLKNDPKPMNRNGKCLKEFLERNSNLYLVNGTEECKGDITRQRITKDRVEESILDLFIIDNIAISCLDLFQRSDLTFPQVFQNQHFKPFP